MAPEKPPAVPPPRFERSGLRALGDALVAWLVRELGGREERPPPKDPRRSH